MMSALAHSGAVTARAAPTARAVLYSRLLSAARGDPNDRAIAGMCATWAAGEGALGRWMGLSPTLFREMAVAHFGDTGRRLLRGGDITPPERPEELDDLRDLLKKHRARRRRSERWIVELICAGCEGRDHLWSDLGLMSRPELTELMRRNFPQLAADNNQNMRWKKFLYKRLCEGEGIYICRAPSCEVCIEKAECFPPPGAV